MMRASLSGARRPCRLGAGLALAAALYGAPPLAAEVSAPHVTGIALTPQVQESLGRIEETWLQWTSAHFQRDYEAAGERVAQLLSTAREIGLGRLPDLSDAALAKAVEAAREGDDEAARGALEAAERLDPGRPENAFAASRVAHLRGRYLEALSRAVAGFGRLLATPVERRLWLANAALWCLYALLISGALFIGLQMASKGSGLVRDLLRLLARLPRPLAWALALVLLLWPLALDHGPLWLVLYWSLLLWGYGSPSERVVLIVLWLLAGSAPLLLATARRQVALELSPPVRAVEAVGEGRLYGALFTDVGVLRSLLPESVAVVHFLADVHRLLGQWDLAQPLYQQVLAAEPERADVLVDVGAYHYYTGDFATAVDYFTRATAADPRNAGAFFNLSQAYSEQYFFDESRQALEQARRVGGEQVGAWLQRSGGERLVTSRSGLARSAAVRGELEALWDGAEGRGRIEVLRRGLSLLAALGLVLTAVTLHLARRPFGYSDPPIDLRFERGPVERLLRAVLPGLNAAEVGDGGRAFLQLLVPVALLLLPLGRPLLFRLPLGHTPDGLLTWLLALAGLTLFMLLRIVPALRRAW